MLRCQMSRWFLLAALLWLCTATAVAAAPPRKAAGPAAAAAEAALDGEPAKSTIVQTMADVITPRECPSIEANGTVCGKVRQMPGLCVTAVGW